MRDDNLKKNKLSWSKSLVRKWFNIKTRAEDFHADEVVYGGDDGDWSRFTEMETRTIRKTKTERLNKRSSDRVLSPDSAFLICQRIRTRSEKRTRGEKRAPGKNKRH